MITAALLTLLFIIHKANSLALNRTDIIDCSENPDLCYQGPVSLNYLTKPGLSLSTSCMYVHMSQKCC